MKLRTKYLGILPLLALLIPTLGADQAKPLWDKYCAACHAKDGSGHTKTGRKLKIKDYRDPKTQEALRDDQAIKAIKEGLVIAGKERMSPYKDDLTDSQIKLLLGRLRAFKEEK